MTVCWRKDHYAHSQDNPVPLTYDPRLHNANGTRCRKNLYSYDAPALNPQQTKKQRNHHLRLLDIQIRTLTQLMESCNRQLLILDAERAELAREPRNTA